jgi:serine/threonine protein kinase
MYIQSRWYRAPEVLLGIIATTKIDSWSVGCLCAEMFLGFAPFRGVDSYDQMQRIAEIINLPNERMREQCAPLTIEKLDELIARNPSSFEAYAFCAQGGSDPLPSNVDIHKKKVKCGASMAVQTDAETEAAFAHRAVKHRKVSHTCTDSCVAFSFEWVHDTISHRNSAVTSHMIVSSSPISAPSSSMSTPFCVPPPQTPSNIHSSQTMYPQTQNAPVSMSALCRKIPT